MDNFNKLLQRARSLGWYGGTHDLLTIIVTGGFEAFSGRASETWETQVTISTPQVQGETGIIWPRLQAKAKDLETASKIILDQLKDL